MRAMRRGLVHSFAFVAAFAATTSAPRARAADADVPSGDEPPRLVPTALVDTYFALHSPSPQTGVDVTSFETSGARQDEFTVNLVSIGAHLEHSHLIGALALQAGSAVDLLYPPTTPGSQNGIGSEVYKHIQVAYAGYRVGDFAFTMGLFPSVMGFEGWQTTSNWNYTKALVTELTPYFHEGGKIDWSFAPGFTATLVVNNGWQTHGHTTSWPSLAGHLDWQPNDDVHVWSAGFLGRMGLLSANDALRGYDEFGAELGVGRGVRVAAQAWGAKQDSSKAYGGAAWAKWAFHARGFVALRGEYFHDDDGILFEGLVAPMVPLVDRPAFGGSGGMQSFEAGTLTVGWTPHKNLVVKAEGVYRHANAPAFYGQAQPIGVTAVGDYATEQHSITSLLSAAFVY